MKPNALRLLVVSLGLASHWSLAHAQPVRIEGSSAGLTISQAAAVEFRRGHSSVTVTVGLSGSGGALGKLCRSEVDLVHTARPIPNAATHSSTTPAPQSFPPPPPFLPAP